MINVEVVVAVEVIVNFLLVIFVGRKNIFKGIVGNNIVDPQKIHMQLLLQRQLIRSTEYQ